MIIIMHPFGKRHFDSDFSLSPILLSVLTTRKREFMDRVIYYTFERNSRTFRKRLNENIQGAPINNNPLGKILYPQL